MSIYGYMLNENSLDGCISVFDIDTYYDQLKKGKTYAEQEGMRCTKILYIMAVISRSPYQEY